MEGIRNYGQPPLDIDVDLMMLYGARIMMIQNPETLKPCKAIIIPIEGSGLIINKYHSHCFLNLRATNFHKFGKDYIIKQRLPKELYSKLYRENRLNETPILGNIVIRFPNICPIQGNTPIQQATQRTDQNQQNDGTQDTH